MDIRLPIPKNWQDFENICHRLWIEIWNDHNAQKNGRQGQSQHGVDIFGKPIYTSNYHGIQCKDKDNRLGSILTETELKNECKKAANFKPLLSTFTLATTSQRDEKIQRYYRTLNHAQIFPFEIFVWSWDDIEAEIIYRPMILNHYYPGIQIVHDNLMKIKLNRYSTKDHLYAFFSREIISEKFSQTFNSYLMPVLHELSTNSYHHGQATFFEIKIENNKIILIDDGIAFNPTTELRPEKVSSKSNIGSFVYKTFVDKFRDMIIIVYRRNNNTNCLEFSFDNKLFHINNSDFEINIDFRQAYGRRAAKSLIGDIPQDKKEIILNINEIRDISTSAAVIEESLNKMSKEQTLTVSLPRHDYFSNIDDWFNDERLVIKKR